MNKLKYFTGFFIIIALLTGCTTITNGSPEAKKFAKGGYEEKGRIEINEQGWNWFFRKAENLDPTYLKHSALLAARDKYGEDAEILIETQVESWNPLSLVMLLNSLGWVEDTFLTASVWVPLPPPVVEPPPLPPEPEKEPEPVIKQLIRRSYKVVPEAEYVLDSEFTKVVYRPAEAIESILKLQLDMHEISSEEWEERTEKVPAGGRILISLGRTDLENAISRWFRYSLFQGDTRLFRRRGLEDIPYVPGNDKLWWNDVDLDIKQEWESPLTFIIEDQYQEKTYAYQIIREEWIEEIEL
ncbi:MAG: hypothetical protein JEY99_10830 [Spirochaetales bacterium]|nr:hypothetical protein [Spirochaetales bacterium]